MKAFKLKTSEEEIFAANTIIEALQHHKYLTSNEIDDFSSSDDIVEVPKSEWAEIIIKNEDGGLGDKDEYTLEELMDGQTTPALMCSTCY